MACSCCAFDGTADQHFNAEKVAKELAQYRRKGPGSTTRQLRDGILSSGLRQGTVLDIGGGLGILSLELLDNGFSGAIVVDASSAYLAAAREEASRRGRITSTRFVHGDFVAVSTTLAPSTTVTLDRVVCCYPFYEALLTQALRLAERGFAFSYPKNRWFVLRTYVHSTTDMRRVIERAGFKLVSSSHTLSWSCDVFVRQSR